jgi:hypothetical protein
MYIGVCLNSANDLVLPAAPLSPCQPVEDPAGWQNLQPQSWCLLQQRYAAGQKCHINQYDSNVMLPTGMICPSCKQTGMTCCCHNMPSE